MKLTDEQVIILDQGQKENTYAWLHGYGRIMFREKLNFWSERMGVIYNRVRIKDVKTRWGSCSSKSNLNFSWKLFIIPERLLDYVIVHELAHLKQMNHSKEFWDIVEKYLPDYKIRRAELKRYI